MGGSTSKDESTKHTDDHAVIAQQEAPRGGVHFLEFHAGTFQLTAGYIIAAALGAWLIYRFTRACKKRAHRRAHSEQSRALALYQPHRFHPLGVGPTAFPCAPEPGRGRVLFDWDRFEDVTDTAGFREDMRTLAREMARAQAAAGRRGLGREEARRENARPEAARRLGQDEIRIEREN